MRFKNGDTDFPPSVGLQKFGMYIVLSALTAEYICLLINIVWMIVEMLVNRKKKKTKKDKYIVYKTIK
jgi:hypothetical protein